MNVLIRFIALILLVMGISPAVSTTAILSEEFQPNSHSENMRPLSTRFGVLLGYRILWDLVGAGVLALEHRGDGRTPSRYRKTGAATETG